MLPVLNDTDKPVKPFCSGDFQQPSVFSNCMGVVSDKHHRQSVAFNCKSCMNLCHPRHFTADDIPLMLLLINFQQEDVPMLWDQKIGTGKGIIPAAEGYLVFSLEVNASLL